MFGGICRLFLARKRKKNRSGGGLEGGGGVVCGFFCLVWWLVMAGVELGGWDGGGRTGRTGWKAGEGWWGFLVDEGGVGGWGVVGHFVVLFVGCGVVLRCGTRVQ